MTQRCRPIPRALFGQGGRGRHKSIAVWRTHEPKIQSERKPEELRIQHTPNYQTKKFSHAVRRNGNDLTKECSDTTPQKPQGPERTW
jgi:hypothetical protein